MAMALAENCYELKKDFPRVEMYVMTSQIRRASVSVAANIAEGHGRETTNAFVQFLRVAQGSLKELETLLLLSVRVGNTRQVAVAPMLDLADELGRALRGLVRSLQRRMEG